MNKVFLILLILVTASTQAEEVFKCQQKSGKTVYQSTPCKSSGKQKTIEIQKVDPRKAAEEEAKLKAWEKDFAMREAERLKAEKERQAELDRKASVEALKRSAEYEKQQAIEAKRQADALERQNMPPAYPQYLFPPYYPAYPSAPFRQSYPVYPPVVPPHQHFIKERTIPSIPQTQQTDTAPDKNKYANPPPEKFIYRLREAP